MQGLPGLNYIVAEADGANPAKDPRVPGKQQSVISFTKKNIPNINVAAGDGFPTKLYFNGEECSLPKLLPTSSSSRISSFTVTTSILAAVVVLCWCDNSSELWRFLFVSYLPIDSFFSVCYQVLMLVTNLSISLSDYVFRDVGFRRVLICNYLLHSGILIPDNI